MTVRYHATIALSVTLLFFSSPKAVAQHAASFEQLELLIKPGDTVSVIEYSGQKSKGKIADVAPRWIRLVVDGVARDIAKTSVFEIQQRRSDHLGNGAKNGALIGAGLGIANGLLPGAPGGPGSGVKAAVMFTGFGAGIGLGIDALIVRTQVIYRIDLPTLKRLSIKPFIHRGNKGVKLSVSF